MAAETQSVDILDCYSVLEDPRQRTKVIYPLPEILLLVLCGVMAGADPPTGPSSNRAELRPG